MTSVRTQAGLFPGLNQPLQEPREVQPYIGFSNLKKANMTQDTFSLQITIFTKRNRKMKKRTCSLKAHRNDRKGDVKTTLKSQ